MSEAETAIERRLAKLEDQSSFRFFIQMVLIPLIVAIGGWYFNNQIEKTKIAVEDNKTKLQQLDIQAKRVDAVRSLLPELSAEPVERVLLAAALIETMLDESIKPKLTAAVQARLQTFVDGTLARSQANPSQSGKELSKIQELTSTAENLAETSQAAKNFVQSVKGKYYVVVSSQISQDAAIALAKKSEKHGYKAEVYSTTNPYFAVVIGILPFNEAKQLGDAAVANGHAKDYFIAPGSKFIGKIYPPASK